MTIEQDTLPAPGQRIALLHTDDPWTRLEPGDRGTVTRITDEGVIVVAWDSGSRLGLIVGRDAWEVRT